LIDEFKIGNVDIKNYSVVYPVRNLNGEKAIALEICNYISDVSGYVLNCYSDVNEYNGGYEIQVGKTERVTESMIKMYDDSAVSDSDCYIGCTDNFVWLYGNSKTAITVAQKKLLNMVDTEKSECVITLSESQKYAIVSTTLSVLTYNVRYLYEKDKRNPDDVVVTLNNQNADVFGTQETSISWMNKINATLSDKYTCVQGKANTGTNSQYNAIFYLTDKYTLIESGTKWMSSTSDIESKFSESQYYRIFSYVILEDKVTKIRFMYVNVHLDYNSDTAAGNVARALQMPVLLDFLDSYKYLSVIFAGDFNTTPTSSVINSINNTDYYSSSSVIATEKTESGTLVNNYTDILQWVYDYCFVSNNCITVQKYEAVNNLIDGKYPSDHLPIRVELTVYGCP